MSLHSTDKGSGFTTKTSCPGYRVVDAGTGSLAEFVLDSREKSYSFRSKTVVVNSVNGGAGKSYTVLAEAIADTDNFGPYRISSTAEGVNVLLDVGLTSKQQVPRSMRSVAHYVFKIGTEAFISEEVGTLNIDLSGTRNANSTGQNFDNVVAAIRSTLAERGYRDNHP
jgi:hypothetical protein